MTETSAHRPLTPLEQHIVNVSGVSPHAVVEGSLDLTPLGVSIRDGQAQYAITAKLAIIISATDLADLITATRAATDPR